LTQLRKHHGNKEIGRINVDDAVLGMRGLSVLFHDNSALDPQKGITFKGYSIPEFQ
jgi:citrate synthase